MIERLTVSGLRGFASEQSIGFACPNGTPGSGLTILVGPNNGGKSTIIEALRLLSSNSAPPLSEGCRNAATDARIRIRIDGEGQSEALVTVDGGGSQTRFERPEARPLSSRLFLIPSRRSFPPFFGQSVTDRAGYTANYNVDLNRSPVANAFGFRLFRAQENRAKFDEVMRRILDPVPDWVIELGEGQSKQHYLKISRGSARHNSEGLGEGVISLLFIVDGLYDSNAGDIIAVDEPELSLHPALQQRLQAVIADFARDRQIVMATHSPRFVDTSLFSNGQQLARVFSSATGIQIAIPTQDTLGEIANLGTNLNNPHVVGTDAKEVFFLDDRVVLLEGQEDAVFYPRMYDQLGMIIPGDFFGWGVGGAANMPLFARLLKELGFRKVAGILDADQAELTKRLANEFSHYYFNMIRANDIRTKPDREATKGKQGLFDESNQIRPEYVDATRTLLAEVETFLTG